MCKSCDDIVTSDLSRFGFREKRLAAELLLAYTKSTPDWLGDNVTIALNTHSGNVFLTDEDFNVGMMNGETLEQWHWCGECGNEGFAEDVFKLVAGDDDDDEPKRVCNSCEHEF
jgi:hypothetical protein